MIDKPKWNATLITACSLAAETLAWSVGLHSIEQWIQSSVITKSHPKDTSFHWCWVTHLRDDLRHYPRVRQTSATLGKDWTVVRQWQKDALVSGGLEQWNVHFPSQLPEMINCPRAIASPALVSNRTSLFRTDNNYWLTKIESVEVVVIFHQILLCQSWPFIFSILYDSHLLSFTAHKRQLIRHT